jgi:hypothetical protein
MEEIGWKKDITPYIIFKCAKCKQYLYVKTTQKGKRCLRCGRNHTVSAVRDKVEIVYGLTAAVKKVKEKQNELAERELGHKPEFRSSNDFKVAGFPSSIKKRKLGKEKDFTEKFQEMLREISNTYKKFPSYVFEIMAEDYGIPLSELKILVHTFQNEGILIRLSDNVYSINL